MCGHRIGTQERGSIELNQEPRGEAYEQLLRWMQARFTEGLLVHRLEDALGLKGEHLLAELGPFFESISLNSHWPGTRLEGHQAEVIRFKLNEESLRILLAATDGLFDWQAPDLPEDLCVLRSNGEAVMTNIAHEATWLLELTDAEFCQLQEEAPLVVSCLPAEWRPQ